MHLPIFHELALNGKFAFFLSFSMSKSHLMILFFEFAMILGLNVGLAQNLITLKI